MTAARPSLSAVPTGPARLAGLDALRGLAALCVLYFHVIFMLTPVPELKAKGYLAVDFFFMLSGYIIARTYERRFAEGYGSRRFMWGRYRRLWPVMAIGAAIGAPIVAIGMNDTPRFILTIVPNVLLLPTFTSNVAFPVNVAAWSIFAELAVNLLHVLVLWRLRSGALLVLAIALVPVLVGFGFSYGTLDIGASAETWMTGVPRALFSYIVGILIWRRWQDSLPLRPGLTAPFIGLPLLLLPPLLPSESWWFDLGFIVLASPLLIAGGLSYAGTHWALRWLGMISFPLYAVNMPLLYLARAGDLGPFIGSALVIALASAIAWLLTPGALPGLRKNRQVPPAIGEQDIERGCTLQSG